MSLDSPALEDILNRTGRRNSFFSYEIETANVFHVIDDVQLFAGLKAQIHLVN